ncbi:NAD(P)H-binding protein [Nocardia yamanashiensis]|uniref:NAD(P)H-binding protein n=1 Tax=Nocardia yamanashiensis TaxID=209247 RepID=UPI001E62711C|nr:NAD(P)H-binding protein [Nocardia yamanashiensis]UGT44041.1 NAD(P)H-binding protein [Nocardia yamanashiensis]
MPDYSDPIRSSDHARRLARAHAATRATPRLTKIVADVFHTGEIDSALEGSGLVLSGLGVPKGTKPGVLTAGARSAVASGARVIWLGAYGTGPSAAVASTLNRLVLKGLGAEVADKVESDAIVTEAGGTVFHAGPLSNKPISPDRRAVGLDASPRSIFRIMVSRNTVAAAMLDEAENPRFPGRIAVPLTR